MKYVIIGNCFTLIAVVRVGGNELSDVLNEGLLSPLQQSAPACGLTHGHAIMVYLFHIVGVANIQIALIQ